MKLFGKPFTGSGVLIIVFFYAKKFKYASRLSARAGCLNRPKPIELKIKQKTKQKKEHCVHSN